MGECERVVAPCYARVDVCVSVSWAMEYKVGRVAKPITAWTRVEFRGQGLKAPETPYHNKLLYVQDRAVSVIK